MEAWRGRNHPSQFDGKTDPNALMPYMSRASTSARRRNSRSPAAPRPRSSSLKPTDDADNWVLHLECFDPHEPFFAAARFRDGLPTNYQGPVLDNLRYGRPDYLLEEQKELRANYLALVAMCDEYLGRVLPGSTTTTPGRTPPSSSPPTTACCSASTNTGARTGRLSSTRSRTSRCSSIIRTSRSQAGARRQSLTQTIDLMPTILDLFGAPCPPEVRGRSLRAAARRRHPHSRRRDLRPVRRRDQRHRRTLHLFPATRPPATTRRCSSTR